jgi:hypothetical protein
VSTPAVEVRSFAVVIPGGTTKASPFTEDIYMPPRELVAVSWRVPPGPSGLMGWRLTMSGGVPVIPTGGGWIVADDQYETWPLTSQPDSGAWEVTGYNTGAYDHAVYLDFLVDLVGQAVASPALVSIPASGYGGGGTVPATVPVTVSTYTTAPYSVSIPPVSVPGITVPPVTVPATTPGGPPGTTIPALAPPVPVTVPGLTVPRTPPVHLPGFGPATGGGPPPVTVSQPVFADVIVPDVRGLRRGQAGPVIRAAGLHAHFDRRDGIVTGQHPAPGAVARRGAIVQITLRAAGHG